MKAKPHVSNIILGLIVPGNLRQAALKENEPKKKNPRTFDYKWKENRPWFKYDLEEDVMTCSLCIEYGQKAESGNLKNKHLFQKIPFKKLSAKVFWCLAEFEKMADKMSGNPTFDVENSAVRLFCLFQKLLSMNWHEKRYEKNNNSICSCYLNSWSREQCNPQAFDFPL